MGILSELMVLFTANVKPLTEATKKAGDELQKLGGEGKNAGDNLTKGLRPASDALDKLASIAKKVAVAVAGYAAVTSAFAKADNLKKTAINANLSVEALQKLQFAAVMSGQSVEKMDALLIRFSSRLGQITEGGGQVASALATIGLSTRDLVGKGTEEAFTMIVDGLSKVSDVASRNSAGMALLGRDYIQFGELIRGGAKGLREFGNEAEKSGTIVKSSQIAVLSDAKQKYELLGVQLSALNMNIVSRLAPTLMVLGETLNNLVTGFDKESKAIMGTQTATLSFSAATAAAVATMKTVWDGLNMTWIVSKQLLGGVMLIGLQAAKALTYAFNAVTDPAGNINDWMNKSIETTKAGLSKLAMEGLAAISDEFATDLRRATRDYDEATKKMEGARGRIGDTPGIKQLDAAQKSVSEMMSKNETELGKVVAKINEAGGSTAKWEDEFFRVYDQISRLQKKMSEVKASDPLVGSQPTQQENPLTVLMRENARRQEKITLESKENLRKIGQEAAMREIAMEANQYEERYAFAAQFHERMKRQEFEASESTRLIWESSFAGKMQTMSQFFGYAVPLMESKSRKLFEVGKVAAIAQATVDTIQAAQSSYKWASAWGGPPAGAIAAATATLAGITRIQALKATQFGGGGSAGGGSAGGGGVDSSSVGGPERAGNTQVNVTLQGSSFSAQQVRSFIGLLNEQVANGASINVQGGA